MSENNKVVLICGEGNVGKSSSIRNIKNIQNYVYFNTDNKSLPLRGGEKKFKLAKKITNPLDLLSFMDQVEESESVEGIIIDTLTFLMNMYERHYVKTATNTQTAWGDYADFYGQVTDRIKKSSKTQIVMAHCQSQLNEQSGSMESKILVKGSVGKLGVDCDYGLIVTAKQMPISKLKQFENPYLTITKQEETLGRKYVFCTQLTKESIGDRTRAPFDFWEPNEVYIDNDVQIILDRMNEFYSTEE